MLKIIAGSLLLFSALTSSAHQPHESINHESESSSDALISVIRSPGDNIIDALKIEITSQPQQALTLLSTKVPPAHATRLSWQPQQSLDGL
ncbi:MAG: hypothetical protein OEY66_13125, partial [Gammaproteobacteria bacterium]|nr:hypothetical protein [Gammaproteobacteria bacterium]